MTAGAVYGGPGSFAEGVLRERNPAIVDQVAGDRPYPPAVRRALDALRAEITTGVVTPLPVTAYDHGAWAASVARYAGRPWIEAPFLWAESYFYRRLLDAVGYFAPGPWHGVDPFGPRKAAELAAAVPPDAGDWDGLTLAALWGNRADLGFRLSVPGLAPIPDGGAGLIVDDRGAARERLRPGAAVVLVADNAAGELLADLALVDFMLRTGVRRVELHLKPYPYFVSDATIEDLLAALDRMGDGASGLRAALADGRLEPVTHPFYCAPAAYRDMPGDLRARLARADLTIFKGDLNYRRLVGDRHWPATTPLGAVTGWLPSPALALRTLKSDVVVGLTDATVRTLDATGTPWRVTGEYGVAQLAGV